MSQHGVATLALLAAIGLGRPMTYGLRHMGVYTHDDSPTKPYGRCVRREVDGPDMDDSRGAEPSERWCSARLPHAREADRGGSWKNCLSWLESS